jgi:hypothetical protein
MNDQTKEDFLDFVNQDSLGTGIFLIADVESDIYGAANKVFVQDITYSECIKRGQFAMAFKWVPNSEASVYQLRDTSCTPHSCVKSCVEKGCMCNEPRGICQ